MATSQLKFKNDTANSIAIKAVAYDMSKRINGKLNNFDKFVEEEYADDKTITKLYNDFRSGMTNIVKKSKAELIKVGNSFEFDAKEDLPVLASKIRENITVVLKTMYSQENLKMFNSTERGKSFVNDLTKTIMEVGVILQELEDNFSDFKNRKINKLNSILFEGALTPSAWSSVLGTDWSNFEYFGKYVSNEGSFVRMVSMLTELYGFKTERFKSKFMENVTSTVGERTQEIVGRDLTALLVPNEALDDLLEKRLPDFVNKVSYNAKTIQVLQNAVDEIGKENNYKRGR